MGKKISFLRTNYVRKYDRNRAIKLFSKITMTKHKNPDKIAQGKANRRKGAAFERKTKAQLEHDGFIVDRWSNNIDIDQDLIIQAKSNRWNSRTTGFPDFVAISKRTAFYKVIWIECKTNNTLTKKEKLKLAWMVDKGMECWVAYEEDKDVRFRKFNGYEQREKNKNGSNIRKHIM